MREGRREGGVRKGGREGGEGRGWKKGEVREWPGNIHQRST